MFGSPGLSRARGHRRPSVSVLPDTTCTTIHPRWTGTGSVSPRAPRSPPGPSWWLRSGLRPRQDPSVCRPALYPLSVTGQGGLGLLHAEMGMRAPASRSGQRLGEHAWSTAPALDSWCWSVIWIPGLADRPRALGLWGRSVRPWSPGATSTQCVLNC